MTAYPNPSMPSDPAFVLATGVTVSSFDDDLMVFSERDDVAHRVTGLSARALRAVLDGQEILRPEFVDAIQALEAAGIIVENTSTCDGISRRRALLMSGSAAALGVFALTLPASQVAASYEGYGASFASGDGFGALAGFGDPSGKYYTSTKVDVSGVPEQYTQVRVTLAGGAGADVAPIANGSVRGQGGRGALVQVVFGLGDATHLHLYVGGRGGASNFPLGGGQISQTGMPSASAEYWGGSAGGTGGAAGGGGGAASVLYRGTVNSNGTLSAIAGGGGGGGGGKLLTGGTTFEATPGGAGGDAGRGGLAGGGSPDGSATGGGGATPFQRGSAGTGGANASFPTGTNTQGGQGGNAGNGGGGGGGGHFAGGGGGGWGWGQTAAGGGGASSFLLPATSGASGHYYGTNPIREAGWIQLEFK